MSWRPTFEQFVETYKKEIQKYINKDINSHVIPINDELFGFPYRHISYTRHKKTKDEPNKDHTDTDEK